MSELITVNPGTPNIGPTLGLTIISEQPVQLFRENPAAAVIVTGSPGRDTIQVAVAGDGASYRVNAGSGDDNISGGAGFDILAGDEGNDRISGGLAGDRIIGGAGNDRLNGDEGLDVIDAGGGADIVRGGQGNDTLLGGPGNDRLFGENGNDVIAGGDGNDILDGGPKSDFLKGNAGNDILIPGSGKDVMKGGFGNDTFRFDPNSTGPGQLDRIIDFQVNRDKIELSRALLPGADLKVGQLSSDDFAIVPNLKTNQAEIDAVLIYDQKSGIVYYNPVDGKDVPLFQLRAGLGNVEASNFTII